MRGRGGRIGLSGTQGERAKGLETGWGELNGG